MWHFASIKNQSCRCWPSSNNNIVSVPTPEMPTQDKSWLIAVVRFYLKFQNPIWFTAMLKVNTAIFLL